MGKEHPAAEGSKFGIGTESLFFEKVSPCTVGIFPGVDKSLAGPQGNWSLQRVAQKIDSAKNWLTCNNIWRAS